MEGSGKSGEKKLTLLLLCWPFGLLAVHRFYAGKYRSGGLQLLVIATGVVSALFKADVLSVLAGVILFLWWVVDTVRIIMGKFTDKEGKPIVDWV